MSGGPGGVVQEMNLLRCAFVARIHGPIRYYGGTRGEMQTNPP